MIYDVIVAGSGPAGATCAAILAKSGQRVLVLEKSIFPREKVCGDCINPSCWPVLERLDLSDRVLALPHSKLREIEFVNIRGRSITHPLPAMTRGEIAVKRSLFDQLLLQRAEECGAEIRQGVSVTALERGWRVHAGGEVFEAHTLVAADGRNSTVARLLGLLPALSRDRVAIQRHLPTPPDFGDRAVLRFLPEGYCGIASVGGGEINLCLVSRPAQLPSLKRWAEKHFALAPDHTWRTITPLSRRAIPASAENLFLVGDVARVVEPFTGEGIFYALASGELAARHISAKLPPESYLALHASLYRGRLWVNQLSRQAVVRPRIGSLALDLMRFQPKALAFLTSKIVGEKKAKIA